MFYWKYNKCSINAVEVSQRAFPTVEGAVRVLNVQADLHSNTSAVRPAMTPPPLPNEDHVCFDLV